MYQLHGAHVVDLPESAWEQDPPPSNRLVGKKNCRYQGAIVRYVSDGCALNPFVLLEPVFLGRFV